MQACRKLSLLAAAPNQEQYFCSAGDCIVKLSGHAPLEEQLKAAVPDWQQAFCNSCGQLPGQPTCLLISPAALAAIAMIKSLPAFNKVATCMAARFAGSAAALQACIAPNAQHRLLAPAQHSELNIINPLHLACMHRALIAMVQGRDCKHRNMCSTDTPSLLSRLAALLLAEPNTVSRSSHRPLLLAVQACRIAKLFAKHLKVAQQQEYLQQHPACIAAGTPNRLCKLADIEALQLSKLRLVVLDVSQDAKQR